PRSANFCDYQVTVEAIEHKTKPVLTLWSALPEAVASEVKTTKGSLAQKLGCR
ncbi:TPA: DNA/RNA non-specific endonuclease, partial [Salmonella enterica subsp. enterica serovar Heidelberg]|nr:DNA/RNA non-specific endonuclease [Salmonella enterica subsp. enterica serovar Heidelberg]